ncbi:MAG: TolC family protein [Acidobacteriota bacterium]|nr:TolC family protein [Acidobacteriota bacterium]
MRDTASKSIASRWLRAAGLMAVFVAANAAASAQVSLITVVSLAQRNSTQVHKAQADLQHAHAALSESKDVFFPSLDLTTGLPAFPETGFTGSPPSIWSATVQSLVFSVPQKNYISSAGTGVKAAIAALKDAQEQVALDASTDYIELDTINRELNAARQQEDYASKLVEIEQQRAEAGIDPLSDYLEAKLTAAQIKLKRLHLETRAGVLAQQLAALTGMPAETIQPLHSSIPQIPKIQATDAKSLPGIESAKLIAKAKFAAAKGDQDANYYPQLSFYAQYNRNTTLLNEVNSYFAKPLPANNFSSGIGLQIPLFNMRNRAKSRESAADALKAKVEAEEAEHQNNVAVARLTGSLRELDTLAEIASLKQQIAAEQLKTVQTQLEYGNGSGSGPGSTPQLSPKAQQQALIDESVKSQDAMDASFQLAKARLGLMRALGHMGDWLRLLNPPAQETKQTAQ